MIKHFFSLSAAKSLTGLILFSLMTSNAWAAAILSLTGSAADVKYESDAEVRISVIGWSDESSRMAIENAYRQFQEDEDLDTFLETVEAQDSRGYLFSAAATGYSIKYAWQQDVDGGQLMHFLVTPGLKTRNPYLWNTPNNKSQEYSFVQVLLNEDETGIAKTSLEGEIVINSEGRLQLEGFEKLRTFATLKDSTPYYLK